MVAVGTGLVSIGAPAQDDRTAVELAGARSTVGDGYGNRGDLFVVTENNRLYRFDKLGTGRPELNVAVTGLAAGERLVGIDTRSLGDGTPLERGRNLVRLRIESLHLNPGVYQVAVWAAGPEGERVYDRVESAFTLQVVDPHPRPPGQSGVVTCRFQVLPED